MFGVEDPFFDTFDEGGVDLLGGLRPAKDEFGVEVVGPLGFELRDVFFSEDDVVVVEVFEVVSKQTLGDVLVEALFGVVDLLEKGGHGNRDLCGVRVLGEGRERGEREGRREGDEEGF